MTSIDHDTADEYASYLAKRQGRRATAVRSAFFYRSDKAEPEPPATDLLRNRSRAGLHLKLALFYLWCAGSESPDPNRGDLHTVRGYSDSDIAKFFGFTDPDTNGKRRIANARLQLRDRGLIGVTTRPGRSPVVRLQREDGSGQHYVPPGSTDGGGKYYKLPVEFWTNLWHVTLSGPAVVAILVLQHMDQTTNNRDLWVNPTMRTRHFGFSEETWYRGVNELCHYQLATRAPKPIRQKFEDEARRRRFTYQFDINSLRSNKPPKPNDPHRIIREDTDAQI
ncbi:MAG: hypothetical protein QF637_05860 [Acidimicrobiales bacterium]|nr:hypothetical protein [Acidimicrobiales bacterium]